MGNLHIRRFGADVARHDFIGLGFKAGGFFDQQRGELRVPCGAGKTQERHRLARQIPSTDHAKPPTKLYGRVTLAGAISFVKSVKLKDEVPVP